MNITNKQFSPQLIDVFNENPEVVNGHVLLGWKCVTPHFNHTFDSDSQCKWKAVYGSSLEANR